MYVKLKKGKNEQEYFEYNSRRYRPTPEDKREGGVEDKGTGEEDGKGILAIAMP